MNRRMQWNDIFQVKKVIFSGTSKHISQKMNMTQSSYYIKADGISHEQNTKEGFFLIIIMDTEKQQDIKNQQRANIFIYVNKYQPQNNNSGCPWSSNFI